MKNFGCQSLFIAAILLLPGVRMQAQSNSHYQQKSLFQKDSLFELTITGNVRETLNDRADISSFHDCALVFKEDNGITNTIKCQLKTRGHFRKSYENCSFPPLLISFSDSSILSTVFNRQEKLKLVVPCRGDEYIVREWLAYKLYNLITPLSLKARLVKVTLQDSKKGKQYPPMFAMLLENDNAMATRNEQTVLKETVPLAKLDRDAYIPMAIFQYLIGNTDWSVEYLQNIILLQNEPKQRPLAVAYDFDHAGIVNAPYAKPEEALELGSVTDRLYRGFCIQDIGAYKPYLQRFIDLKEAIYSLYNNCPYIDNKYKSFAIKFFDDFYSTINNRERLYKEFTVPCNSSGPGSVIIKGLKKQ